MDGRQFDALLRALIDSRRSLVRSGLAALAAPLGLAAIAARGNDVAARKRKKHKKRKKKRRCKKQECCRDADCGPLFLCAQGTCVMGQGTCQTGTNNCQNISFGCGVGPESECACLQSTIGETRCGANTTLPDSECSECVNDDDCGERYPAIPGVFCARGGPECPCASPSSGFCQAPCDD